MNEQVLKIIADYVGRYIISLLQEDATFEYYWMNKKYPQCVWDDMSDYEIAYRYPLSGERLVLDCWAAVSEFCREDDWAMFAHFVDSYVKDCLNKIECMSNDE